MTARRRVRIQGATACAAVDIIMKAVRPPLLVPRPNAADVDRISRRLRRVSDREIPCRAILLPRVSLPQLFAFEQMQNLSSVCCADNLRPLRFARFQRR